ncbi:major facilitator superfamily [Stemphylium lycopersici]|nr:major facilitator superfamily [Stemphylium lycopersici]
MNNEDRYIENAERDASPNRFPRLQRSDEKDQIHEPAGHRKSLSDRTFSSNPSLDASEAERDAALSRILTEHDNVEGLERHATALDRIHTARSQHSQTVGSGILRSRSSRKPVPPFGAGKPYPPPLPNRDEYVVEFDGPNDPLHAQNWPFRKKIYTAVMLGFTTLSAAFGSSIFSAATRAIEAKFHVGSVVATLGTSLYVLGFATGPILWAPFSELKGRRLPLVIASFGFSVFNISVAVGKDLQTVLICRFFAGFFGACPLTCVAAVFSDIFDSRTRGMAVTVFSMTVFTGPLLAPFIGGFIVMSDLGWRWTEYIVAFMGFAVFVLNLFFLPESYPPAILVSKAEDLRRLTKNWGIHAKQEEIEIDFRELLEKNFSRPLRMLVTERIVLLLSIYMAFIYGLLYLFLTAYPLVFQGVHGMNPGVGGLPYFGMITGQLTAGTVIFLRQPGYQRKLAANNGVAIPEWRLPEIIVGGVCFAIGLFWFGWTGYRQDIHWIVPTLSGLLTGFGLLSVFLQSLNYLIDAYLMNCWNGYSCDCSCDWVARQADVLGLTQEADREHKRNREERAKMVFNCSTVPETTNTDAGVAGAGTLLSFIITNILSILLSATIILLGLRKSTSAPISRKLLQSFSDQQILTGIGIQSVGLAKMKTMVPYHFFIIWLLSLLSTATNLATLLALVNDFKRDWVLRWIRQLLMLVNMFLGILSGVFILQTVMKNMNPRLPIACVWEVESKGSSGNAALSIAGTIAVIAGQVITFGFATWYLHNRSNPKWLKTVQVIGLFACLAMGVGATVRVVLESQAFGTPPQAVHLVGPSEGNWSFGQLLPLLLLALPVISTIEIARGEELKPKSRVDEDTVPLFANGSDMEFQPNPLAGSGNSLFRK